MFGTREKHFERRRVLRWEQKRILAETKRRAVTSEDFETDIDAALAQSANFKAFETRLKDMGYEICRGENFAHYSVKGTGWQRAVRSPPPCGRKL